MDNVWKLRQKVNLNSRHKTKQISIIYGKKISLSDRLSDELLTSLGTKPKSKYEILKETLNKIPRKKTKKEQKIIEENIDFLLNYLLKQGKINLILDKYHRIHVVSNNKKKLVKSRLRNVTFTKA